MICVFILPQIVLSIVFKNSKVLGASINLSSEKIVSLTNEQRLENNLDTLKFNEKLTKAAEEKLNDMFSQGYWDHNSPKKIQPWTFILEQDYDYHFAGENLAKDFVSEEELIQAWMDSPDHRANILNKDYKEIGIAVATGELNGKETILAVQMFGTEFGEQDYKDAGLVEEKIEQSYPLISKKLTFKEIFYNRFMTAKTMAFASILVLMFYLAFRFNQDKRKKGFKLVMRKYWGHFVFLFFLGILVWMTKDVDVL